MAIKYLGLYSYQQKSDAVYLIKRLAEEAGVCLNYLTIAEWEVNKGLIVGDGEKRYRLKITAEEIHDK